jgi:hypothetical protein
LAKKFATFDDLLDEAVSNAKLDRKLALDAFAKMKGIFDVVDLTDQATLQSVMLTGQQAVKLLESSSRSNEQIIKAASLKQKDKPKVDEDDRPFDPEALKREEKDIDV